jgi:hypothetical protein
MDPIRNPFAPGAGTPPPELAGRAELLGKARVALGRIRAGRPEKSLIAVGLRGVGKTVLLNRLREIAVAEGFRTSIVEAHEDKSLPALLLPELRRILLELDRLGTLDAAVKRGLRVLRSFASAVKLKHGDVEIGLDLDPEIGTADSGDLEADLPELFRALGRAAAARGSAVALFVDEIQYLGEREMSALIMALHRTAQESLPVIMMAAGLPQVVGLSGRSKTYAERLFDFPRVGALSAIDAGTALRQPVRAQGVDFSDEALAEILRLSEGYPFFLQEWGYAAWNIAPASPIAAADVAQATVEAIRKLDDSFFRVRFDRLTPRERDYLRAMAELGPTAHRSGDIADLLGVPVTSVGPLRQKLVRKGMVYGPAHGDTAFTVPMFDRFMKRTMPDWKPGR